MALMLYAEATRTFFNSAWITPQCFPAAFSCFAWRVYYSSAVWGRTSFQASMLARSAFICGPRRAHALRRRRALRVRRKTSFAGWYQLQNLLAFSTTSACQPAELIFPIVIAKPWEIL